MASYLISGLKMGRKPREEAAGETYHIIQRGHNKSYIYGTLHDKIVYLDLLAACLEKFHLILHYFVLMDNHYHLLLEMGDISIQRGMQFLNQSYTRYFNRSYNRCGTVYDGRYSSKRITSDAHYLKLLRYQAYNPVQAGIVKYPGEYRWSAHREILEGRDSLVTIHKVLLRFSHIPDIALQRYRAFIESDQPVFPEGSRDEALPKYLNPPREHLQYLFDEMELSEYEQKLFFSRYRGKAIVALRKEFIRKAAVSGHPLRDVAAYLQVSYETVRMAVAVCSTGGR